MFFVSESARPKSHAGLISLLVSVSEGAAINMCAKRFEISEE